MKIGELASNAGVHIQTVRYYERRGLLADPRQSAAGYREYDTATIHRLRFIRRAQELGFTLGEISELLVLRLDPETSASTVRIRASEKIEEIEGRIHDLERIKNALSHLASNCHGDSGPSGDCPLLEALGPIE